MDDTRPTPDWLEDEPETERAGRRWLLPMLAVVPWTVVLAVILRSAPDPPAAPSVDASSSTPEVAPTAAVSTPTLPAVGPTEEVPATVLTSGARVHPRLGDATALATVVGRAWITGVGPTLDLPLEGGEQPEDVYAEHLAVEAVDHPAPGHAVVTLLAVLLHRAGGAYDDVRVRRLAVPVRLDATGAAPAGTPWWLPDPPLALQAPAATPVDDVAALVEAGRAVAAAGYRDVDVRGLSATEGWPLLVQVQAVAPGSSEAGEHVLWLRRHLDGFVVAGDLPRPATTPVPQPTQPTSLSEEPTP